MLLLFVSFTLVARTYRMITDLRHRSNKCSLDPNGRNRWRRWVLTNILRKIGWQKSCNLCKRELVILNYHKVTIIGKDHHHVWGDDLKQFNEMYSSRFS